MIPVTHDLRAAVASAPLHVSLSWDSRNPFEVRMGVHPTEGGVVPWVLDRDLLEAGVQGPSGLGDIQISPGVAGRTIIVLSNANGRAVLTVDTAEVQAFLADTWCAEPRPVSDAEIAALIAQWEAA